MPDPGSAVAAQTVQQKLQRRRYANEPPRLPRMAPAAVQAGQLLRRPPEFGRTIQLACNRRAHKNDRYAQRSTRSRLHPNDGSRAAAAFWTRHRRYELACRRQRLPGRQLAEILDHRPSQSLVSVMLMGERDEGGSQSCGKTWCHALGCLRRCETVRLCMPRLDGTCGTRWERLNRAQAAHNPEVAGSNPAPATEKGP
jgi:hypothetical protein